jgi:hypothetical protein
MPLYIHVYIYLVIFVWLFFVYYTFKLSMYIAHTVPGRYTVKPLSLVLYLEEKLHIRLGFVRPDN